MNFAAGSRRRTWDINSFKTPNMSYCYFSSLTNCMANSIHSVGKVLLAGKSLLQSAVEDSQWLQVSVGQRKTDSISSWVLKFEDLRMQGRGRFSCRAWGNLWSALVHNPNPSDCNGKGVVHLSGLRRDPGIFARSPPPMKQWTSTEVMPQMQLSPPRGVMPKV